MVMSMNDRGQELVSSAMIPQSQSVPPAPPPPASGRRPVTWAEIHTALLTVWHDRMLRGTKATPSDHCAAFADAVMEVIESYRMISLVDVVGYRIDGKIYHPVDVDIEVRGK